MNFVMSMVLSRFGVSLYVFLGVGFARILGRAGLGKRQRELFSPSG
jgi:hypothetical protein